MKASSHDGFTANTPEGGPPAASAANPLISGEAPPESPENSHLDACPPLSGGYNPISPSTATADLQTARWPRWLRSPFLLAVASFLLAWGVLGAKNSPLSPSPVWPVNGLALAALLLSSRRQNWRWLTAQGAGVLLAHAVLHHPWPVTLGFTFCSVAETAVAFLLLAPRLPPGAASTVSQRTLVKFGIFGVALPPAASGLLAALLVHALYGASLASTFLVWYPANTLGIATVTPLLYAVARGEMFYELRPHRLRRSLTVLLPLLVVAVAISWQSRYPLFFAVFPFLLLVVIYLGFGMGYLSAVIVGAVYVIFTLAGHGPTMLTGPVSYHEQILLLQFFLAVALVSMAEVAVVLSERQRLSLAVFESDARYRLLAENSRDLIELIDLSGCRLYVSPIATELLGWSPEEMLRFRFPDDVIHADDADTLRTAMTAMRNGNARNTLTYRVRQRSGEMLWVEANIRSYCDPDTGAPVGFVNVVRDISERKAAESQLQIAYRELEALAIADSLTGLANRRRFDEVLDHEWRRAARHRTSLALLMADVDHFKRFNDLYGHLRGDGCLKRIADAILQTARRPADLVARFGGEEFAIILPNTSDEGALELAEQIRKLVEDEAWVHPGNPGNVVTISIGCAVMVPDRHNSAMQLLEAADAALYEAKRKGRNRVEARALQL